MTESSSETLDSSKTKTTMTATEIPMSSTMSFLEEQMKEVANMMLLPSSSSTMIDHSVEDSTMSTPTAAAIRDDMKDVNQENDNKEKDNNDDTNIDNHENNTNDEEEAYVRQLAASFAPAVEELDALLSSPGMEFTSQLQQIQRQQQQQQKQQRSSRTQQQQQSTTNDSHTTDSDNESIDDELQHLEASELLLRQELEFAHDFGNLMNSPYYKNTLQPEQKRLSFTKPLQPNESLPPHHHHPSVESFDTVPASNHLPSLLDQSLNIHPNQSSDDNDTAEVDSHDGIDDINLDITIYSILPSNIEITNEPEESETEEPTAQVTSKKVATRHSYTLNDHSQYLQLQAETCGGWYHIPNLDIDPTVKEYIVPIPDVELDQLYVGLFTDQDSKEGSKESSSTPTPPSSPRCGLPLRTVAIRIRPDILVGAVMDAIVYILTEDEHSCEVYKRQGGHLIMTSPLDAYLIFDFQVLAYKGNGGSRHFCERILLWRVFYHNTPATTSDNAMTAHYQDTLGDGDTTTHLSQQAIHHMHNRIREAAALVQKLETSKGGANQKLSASRFWGLKPLYPNKATMQEAIANRLLQKHKPCSSVREGNMTIPALSKNDWPWLQYSTTFLLAVWDELQDRYLTYASLERSAFGQFPALSTLDVHYCSQIRRLSREIMILSLLRSASELEQYAREAEYACANLIQLLKPHYTLYGLEPPTLTEPLPLTSYPLDFTPHQELCPPWGQKVMEAMSGVTSLSSSSAVSSLLLRDASSLEHTEAAVQLVLDAFQRQHDEELSARLGRKNLQVMDRLSKMQAHQCALVEKISQSYSKSSAAQSAADDVHRFVQTKVMNDVHRLPPSDQVPLFRCSVSVGSSSGSMYVTARQLVCVTQFIPIVGGTTVVVIDLEQSVLSLQEPPSTSLLHPPPSIVVKRKSSSSVTMKNYYYNKEQEEEVEEILIFRTSSHDAHRLLLGLQCIQSILCGKS